MKTRILILVAALAAVLSSCSKKSATLDVVPADVDFVAVMDVTATAALYDVSFTDTKLNLPKDFPADLIPAEAEEVLVKINNAIDLSSLVCFGKFPTAGEINVYLEAGVKDADLLKNLLTKDADFEKEGADCYSAGSSCNVIIRDNLVWLTNGTPKDVEATAKAAASDAFFSTKIADVQQPEGLSTCYINTSAIASLASEFTRYMPLEQSMMVATAADYLSGKWVIIHGYNEGETLKARAVACDTEGNLLEVPMLKTIDADFLAYVPQSFNTVLAGSLNDDALSIINQLCATFAPQTLSEPLASAATSLVSGLEGTFFISTDITTIDGFSVVPPVSLGLKFKPGTAASAMASLTELVRGTIGSEPEVLIADGTITFRTSSGAFILRPEGDYLIFTSLASGPTGNSKLRDFVAGHLLAFGMSAPEMGYNFGMDVNVYLDSKELVATTRYTKPLPEVLCSVAKTISDCRRILNDFSSQANNYDYMDYEAADTTITMYPDFEEVVEMADTVAF